MNLKPNLDDIKEHNRLADIHLSRYNLPKWEVPCSVEQMKRWLDRLDISERLYTKQTATSLKEFIELNPNLSLRSWIGLVMESKNDRD